MGKMSTSERVEHMKKVLGGVSDVQIGKLSTASKSVVGQWISGKIKEIAPRYAYKLEEKTPFNAKWIMLGEGPVSRDENRGEQALLESIAQQQPIELSKEDYNHVPDEQIEIEQPKQAEPPTYSKSIQIVIDLMLKLDEADQGVVRGAVIRAIREDLTSHIEKDKPQKENGRTGTHS